MLTQQNFNPKEFVQKVLRACKMGDMPQKTRLELEEAIERRLAERVTATIVSNFGAKELRLLDKILMENSGIDQAEAIIMASVAIPELDKKVVQAVQDLFEELTYDADQIEKAMAKSKKRTPARIDM